MLMRLIYAGGGFASISVLIRVNSREAKYIPEHPTIEIFPKITIEAAGFLPVLNERVFLAVGAEADGCRERVEFFKVVHPKLVENSQKPVFRQWVFGNVFALLF